MAREVSIHIEGYDDLSRRLMALPFKIRAKVVRPALRAGAKFVATRAAATSYSRRLRSATWMVRAMTRSRQRVGVSVLSPKAGALGITRADGYWPAFQELGYRVGRRVQGPLPFAAPRIILVRGPNGKTYERLVKTGGARRKADQALQSSRRKIPGRWTFRKALLGMPALVLSEIAREATARMQSLGLDVGDNAGLTDFGGE